MRTFWAVAGVLVLAGCAQPPVVQTVTVTKVVTPDVPAALLACMGEPVLGPVTLQSQFDVWAVRLEVAGEDCRLHLAAVKQALSPAN